MITEEQLARLKGQLQRANVEDPFTDGVALRFVYRGYTYVALRKGSTWYTTSSQDHFVPTTCDYPTLLEYMAHDPMSVRIAVKWVSVNWTAGSGG